MEPAGNGHDVGVCSRQDGTPRGGVVALRGGFALLEACWRKARTCPELNGQGGWDCLVVLASETGAAGARAVPAEMQGSAEAAWRRRWASMLSCAVARAYGLSLLDLRASPGADGDVPQRAEGSRRPSLQQRAHCVLSLHSSFVPKKRGPAAPVLEIQSSTLGARRHQGLHGGRPEMGIRTEWFNADGQGRQDMQGKSERWPGLKRGLQCERNTTGGKDMDKGHGKGKDTGKQKGIQFEVYCGKFGIAGVTYCHDTGSR